MELDELTSIRGVQRVWNIPNCVCYAPKLKVFYLGTASNYLSITNNCTLFTYTEEMYVENNAPSGALAAETPFVYFPSLRIVERGNSVGGVLFTHTGTYIADAWYLPVIEKITGRFIHAWGNDNIGNTMFYLGCKGQYPNSIIMRCSNANDSSNIYFSVSDIEIGDYENINKGLPPRWQPKQSIYIYYCKNLTRENVREHVIDRLAYNDIPNVFLELGLHTDVYNRLTSEDLAELTAKNWSVLYI